VQFEREVTAGVSTVVLRGAYDHGGVPVAAHVLVVDVFATEGRACAEVAAAIL